MYTVECKDCRLFCWISFHKATFELNWMDLHKLNCSHQIQECLKIHCIYKYIYLKQRNEVKKRVFLAFKYSHYLKDICSQLQCCFRTGRKFTHSLPACSAVGMWIYCLNTRQLGCCHGWGETQLNLVHTLFMVHHLCAKIKVSAVPLWPFGGVCRSNYNTSVELTSLSVRKALSWQTCGCKATLTGLQTGAMSRCDDKEENWILATANVSRCLCITPFFCVHTSRLSRMIHSRFFFAQGRSLHQRAADWDPKRGPLPCAPPVQEQALHPHSGEAQMGQVQANLQVFTLLQTAAWAATCKHRLFSDDRQLYCCKIPPLI